MKFSLVVDLTGSMNVISSFRGYLLRKKVHMLTFYEWVNPKTSEGGGAYPFRTGICSHVRWAIDHIVNTIKQEKILGRITLQYYFGKIKILFYFILFLSSKTRI